MPLGMPSVLRAAATLSGQGGIVALPISAPTPYKDWVLYISMKLVDGLSVECAEVVHFISAVLDWIVAGLLGFSFEEIIRRLFDR